MYTAERLYSVHAGGIMNGFRGFLVICLATGGAVWGAPQVSTEIQVLWDAQYEMLEKEISTWNEAPADKRAAAVEYMLDPHGVIHDDDRGPSDVVLRRARAVLENLKANGVSAGPLESELSSLETEAQGSSPTKEMYYKACDIRRKITLANPLMDFDSLIFSDGMLPGANMQYTGWRAAGNKCCGTRDKNEEHYYKPGDYWDIDWTAPAPNDVNPVNNNKNGASAIRVVTNFKTNNPTSSDLLQGKTVTEGRMQGTQINRLGIMGAQFDVDYDAKNVVFYWSTGNDGVAYHLFNYNTETGDLVQLTDGRLCDYEPCFLPHGDIVFISQRTWSHSRCDPQYFTRQPAGQLFWVNPETKKIAQLSYHETNEMQPSIDNDGLIVYTRWDYIDRDYNAAHHMWTCYPDGRDPRAPSGNYPLPHVWGGAKKRGWRPNSHGAIRAIPEINNKYIAIAANHHSMAPGKLIVLNTQIPDDGMMSQTKLVVGSGYATEHCDPPPWMVGGMEASFYSPWPLSEDYYLATWRYRTEDRKHHFAVALLDRFANVTFLYSGNNYGARPFGPRDKPPAIPYKTALNKESQHHEKATISVADVYNSDFDWPSGVVEQKKIKALRIVQIYPMPWSSPHMNSPHMGFSNGGIARGVLGTVPVESDGSAYFEAPVRCEIYFQALDEDGLAIQSMRSGTYVRPGENLSCIGCHEDKWESTPGTSPIALSRAPSPITPEYNNSEPITFAKMVQPIFENKCEPCHLEKGKGPGDLSYCTDHSYDGNAIAGCSPLRKLEFHYDASGWGEHPQGYRTDAGRFGARKSDIGKALLKNHRGDRITEDEFKRVMLWIDANSMRLGAYRDSAAQAEGETVWPILHPFGPSNPQCLDDGEMSIYWEIPDWGRNVSSKKIVGTVRNDGNFSLVPAQNTITVIPGNSFEDKEYSVDIFDVKGRLVKTFADLSGTQRLSVGSVQREIAGTALIVRVRTETFAKVTRTLYVK